jgi:uncharacterized protein (TIGR03118 family)
MSRRPRHAHSSPRREQPQLEVLEARVVLSDATTPYLQTNLVSDVPGLAQVTDSSLVNPWGVSFSSTSPFWVSNQGTSTSTLYAVIPTGISKLGLTVSIPKTAAGPQGPTGQVHNDTSDFMLNSKPAAFIFANLNGTISAWNGGTAATIEATTPGAVYTGLTIATNTAGSFLYAADGAQNRIDVFDGSFTPHSFGPNAFVDPDLKPGLVPFNVKFIDGDIFVAYAPAGHAAQTGAQPGQGAVAAFTTSGHYLSTLISGGKLAAPWGMTLAPAGFGTFSGDLLVGNFAYGDSVINAFDPSDGSFEGTLSDAKGHAIMNPGLWTVTFGNGVNGGDPNTLYFTAGIDGETHGLFGSLQAIPSLSEKAPLVPNLPNGAFQTLTTVPANGDVNPYGVAFVPEHFPTGGPLSPGDLLVSNFNNSSNQQGTGTSIVRISPNGTESVFYHGTSTPGLTTAIGVLKSGFVLVGNLPATYDSQGNLVSIGQGSLTILDKNGNVVDTLTDAKLLDGPWDMTVHDEGDEAQVFVSNVLNGVVTRIDLSIPSGGDPIVTSMTRIASGYLTRTDPAALVVGPTGLAYDAKKDVLYVASTGDNAIFKINDAKDRMSDSEMGTLVYQDQAHLRGPLGLVLAPNGDLIAANGDAVNGDPNQPSELVEFTPHGKFVGQFSIDPAQGAAFGIAVSANDGLLRFAAVEDATNSLDIWTFRTLRSHEHEHDDNGDDSDSNDNEGSDSNNDQGSDSTGNQGSDSIVNQGSNSNGNQGSGSNLNQRSDLNANQASNANLASNANGNQGSGSNLNQRSDSNANQGSDAPPATVVPPAPVVAVVVTVPSTGSGSSEGTTTHPGKGHRARHHVTAAHVGNIHLAQSHHRHSVGTSNQDRRIPHGPMHSTG